KYCGVDTGRLKAYVAAHPERFPALAPHMALFSRDIPVDLEGFEEEFRRAKAEGSLSIRRENILMFATGRPGEYIINTTRIVDHDATD
ncbi:MAG TPA: FAD-dependent oxidoreductase, partial [Akkermansia sp.]|nr:FAD-dependent oxidoreductase [Akkermansia sp.]